MENSTNIPSGNATNNAYDDEKLNDKKPVGYGSSIQNDGLGNRTRPVDKDKLAAEQSEFAKNEEQSDEDAETGHA